MSEIQRTESGRKAPKKKGPIRTEAIVPFLMIVGAATVYSLLFLDTHLRRGMEFVGTLANGAEVNVASVDLRLSVPSFEVRGIQVTNPEAPARNRFEVDRIGIRLLWDALLRAKFVTEDAGVTGIAANTPRKKPGRVLSGGMEKAASDAMRNRLAEMARERLKNSDLARLPEVLKELNPAEVLKDIKDLKAKTYLTELEGDLSSKTRQWEEAVTAIPGSEQAARIQKRVAAISVPGGTNPAEIKKKIEEAQAVIKDADEAISVAKERQASLRADIASLGPALGKIDEKVKADRADLLGRLKLPEIDTSGLTKQLFGLPAVERIAGIEKYTKMARDSIPPKGKAAPEPIRPPARSAGRIYQFGRPKSYPLYWVKRVEISSKVGPSEYSGDLEGELLDLVSDQAAVNRPTVLRLRGDFPKQEVSGVAVNVTIDHRGEVPSDSFRLRFGSFPLRGERILADGKAFRFAMTEGRGSSDLNAAIVGDQVKFSLRNRFDQVGYKITGESEWLTSTFNEVVRGLPSLTLNVNAEGTWRDLKIGFDSNLGAALQGALGRQLSAKLNEARARVDQLIQEQVGERSRMVRESYDRSRMQVTARAEASVKQLEAARSQAVAKVDRLKKQVASAAKKRTDAAKRKAQGAVKDQVKGKLKF